MNKNKISFPSFFRPRLTLVREGLLFSYHLVKKCEFFKNFFTSIRFELFIIDFRGVLFYNQICHSFVIVFWEIWISPKRVNLAGWNLVKSFIREFSSSPVNFRLIRRSLPPKKGSKELVILETGQSLQRIPSSTNTCQCSSSFILVH